VAGYQPTRVEKPWGYELIWARTDRYAGKILHIRKGESLSYQYHRVKEESIYLLRGVMDLEVGDKKGRRMHRLEPGACFHISPETRHRMIALEDCDVLEVSTPELDDVVRLEDRYGRVKPKS
jgi:quercetin dioxygenase-like cupin family protein